VVDDGFPKSLNVDLSGFLTLDLDGDPVIKALLVGEGGDLNLGITDCFVAKYIVVANVESELVALILDLPIGVVLFHLLPDGVLALILGNLGGPLLFTELYVDIGVHLSEGFEVFEELSLKQMKLKFSE